MPATSSIPLDLFTVCDGVLVAEASDFGRGVGGEFELVPATNGGVCHGVTVVDEDGVLTIFRLASVERDADRDVTHWELVASDGRRMTVFND